jgi:hypothetical protein
VIELVAADAADLGRCTSFGVVEWTTTLDRCAETSYRISKLPLMRLRIVWVGRSPIRVDVVRARAGGSRGVRHLIMRGRARLATGSNQSRDREEVHHE